MTSRERIKTVPEHREPDRVPIQDAPGGLRLAVGVGMDLN